jgi:TusA-related sulfurtransferase
VLHYQNKGSVFLEIMDMTSAVKFNSSATLNITFHVVLTLIGTDPPGPLPAVMTALAKMRFGQVLLVISDFPGIEDDVFSWADHTNNQILAVDRNLAAGYGFYILKGDPWPVDVALDTHQAPCPTPVIMSAKFLSQMEPGQCLRLATACHAAVSEVDAWLRNTAYRLLGITEDARGVYRFYIRKE